MGESRKKWCALLLVLGVFAALALTWAIVRATVDVVPAAQRGDARAVRVWLALGASPEEKGRSGHTPLQVACSGGHADVVDALCDWGAKPTEGMLTNAAVAGQTEVVAALVKHGVPLTTASGDNPSLYQAVTQGHSDTVRCLLDLGSDPDALFADGRRPLHIACDRGMVDMARALLEFGADPAPGAAPSLYTPLHAAADYGHTECVWLLLAKGAGVDPQTDHGVTPLSKAAGSRRMDAVAALLEAGADPNLTSALGEGPLHKAAGNRDFAMVRLLLEHGADPSAVTGYGHTAMYVHGGQRWERRKMARILCEHGYNEPPGVWGPHGKDCKCDWPGDWPRPDA